MGPGRFSRLVLLTLDDRFHETARLDAAPLDRKMGLFRGAANDSNFGSARLVALQPEVILAQSTEIAAALKKETRAIPIVFVAVSDPIGSGLVASLARPGGNLTGLLNFERPSPASGWQCSRRSHHRLRGCCSWRIPRRPHMTTGCRRPRPPPRHSRSSVASPVATAADIEGSIASFASMPNGTVLLVPDGTTIVHRDLIIALMARHRLPAVYSARYFVTAGGLMSYGSDRADVFRQAASYVDRILCGAKPADMPVQTPLKYETVVNLKSAKALGIEVPPSLLVRADEVIEKLSRAALAHGRFWPIATEWDVRSYVSSWGQTGRDMLSVRLTGFDRWC